ncbi:MAG: hypothetical protein JST80_06075 [Bdellovibrionales bacterium]|nr:hypothetical protein [Bdellovibrionales bacterium]
MNLFKILTIALVASTASPTFAEEPTEEMKMVVRAVLRSDVTETLQKQNTTDLDEYRIERGEDMVNTYTLKFGRRCHCMPATSTATITEDMKPTTYDGAPVYQATVETTNAGRGSK